MIIDASVAFKWLVEEQDSDLAFQLIDGGPLSAPGLIHSEVANALWKAIGRGEISADGCAEQFAELSRIVVTDDPVGLAARALEIGVELGHPVYDCLYLALAIALDQPLITADERFWRAVEGSSYTGHVQRLSDFRGN